jgi:hypothetical protein
MIGQVAGMTKVVAGEMISVDGMACKSMPAKSVSGEAVRTKSMTHMDRTMGCKAMEAVETAPAKSMKPTASAKSMPTASAKSMPTASAKSMPAASAATSSACKRRDVRHDAKRGHRNAHRQNAYCSFAHSAIPIRSLDRWCGGACITAQTSPHLTFNY